MVEKRKILYSGNDDIFYNDMIKYFKQSRSEDTIISEHLNPVDNTHFLSEFASKIIELLPHMIVIDFSKIIQDKELIGNLLQTIITIKKHHKFRPIPVFALFASTDEFEETKFIFSCGSIVYSHIKGENNETFFNDSFYISYEQRINLSQHTIASHLGLKYYLFGPSCITRLHGDSLQIESDIEPIIDEDIEATTNLFPDFKAKTLDVSFKDNCAIYYDYLYNAELRIPFSGPWDERTEDSFQKNTYDTWIDCNKEKFSQPYDNVLIVTNSEEFLNDFAIYQNNKTNFFYTSHLTKDIEVLKVLKPNLIIFSFDNLHDDDFDIPGRLPNSLNTMTQLISLTKSMPGYMPVVITFNNPSSSEAIQKVYTYNSIIASTTEITIELFDQLLENFNKNYIENAIQEKSYQFNITDNRKIIELKRNISITSLTEHEITFLSEYDMPFYSTVKFDHPFDMYVTVVPSFRQIDNQGTHKHYMGFIHTINKAQLQTLRQFVNYLIFKKPDTFYFDESLIDDKLQEQIDNAPKELKNTKEDKKESNNELNVVREKTATPKSKL
jgi:hypothetical protein